jgi:hypothetical protein
MKPSFLNLFMKKFTRGRVVPTFGQSLLAYPWDYWLGCALFSEAGKRQKRSRQALFTRIEELVDEVRLDVIMPIYDAGDKKVGELVLLV